jgi:hypothetical protein
MATTMRTVGLLSPGEMGHTIGGVLHANGVRVLTHLGGRSGRTRSLAEQAGMEDTASLDDPRPRGGRAPLRPRPGAGRRGRGRGRGDPSAGPAPISSTPTATRSRRGRCGRSATRSWPPAGRFADAGIVGPPPRKPGTTRFYASGPGAAEFAGLREAGLDVRVIGDEIGQASGLKMCYAALTKGLLALGQELLVAARLMGLDEVLREEQRESIPDVLAWLERTLPTMPPKAHRWVGEMEEIAATFGELGMTPDILTGAADVYRFVAETPPGKESPETRDPSRGLDGVVAALAAALGEPVPAGGRPGAD